MKGRRWLLRAQATTTSVVVEGEGRRVSTRVPVRASIRGSVEGDEATTSSHLAGAGAALEDMEDMVSMATTTATMVDPVEDGPMGGHLVVVADVVTGRSRGGSTHDRLRRQGKEDTHPSLSRRVA